MTMHFVSVVGLALTCSQLPAPTQPETYSEAVRHIRNLEKGPFLDELLEYISTRRDLAEQAEGVYRRNVERLKGRPASSTRDHLLSSHAAFIDMGSWLAESLQNPGVIPTPTRRALLKSALARSYTDYEVKPPEWVCSFGVGFPQRTPPDLVKRLLAGAPGLAIELLGDPNCRNKTRVLSALQETRPNFLAGMLPALITDRYSSVRVMAVKLSSLMDAEDRRVLLDVAAEDASVAVRNASLDESNSQEKLGSKSTIDIVVRRGK